MINAAICGIGRWGSTLVRSVQGKSDKIRFVAGVEPQPDLFTDLAAETGMVIQPDLDVVLNDPGIQAVVVASPPFLHREHACRVAAAGKPVHVEKPVALTKQDAEAIVAACKQHGVPLALGFNRRFLPNFKQMQQWLSDGRIGKLLCVEANFSGPTALRTPPDSWRATRAANPAGGLVPRGIHMLDGIVHLCGAAETVYVLSDSRATPLEIDDTTSILMKFRNGTTSYLGTHMATTDVWRLQVFGSEGSIELPNYTTARLSDLDRVIEEKTYDPIDMERAELEYFAEVAAGTAKPVVTFDEAVNGAAAFEAISKAAEIGGEVKVG